MSHLKLIGLVAFSVTQLSITAESFDTLWHNMQEYYSQMTEYFSSPKYKELEQQYCHDLWYHYKELVHNLITGEPNRNFEFSKPLTSSMVRLIMGETAEFELTYLDKCTSPKTKQLLSQFQESPFSLLPHVCEKFDCSSISLGRLYHAARILDAIEQGQEIDTIVEVGAGVGTLAYILKQLLPNVNYIILDLPEVLALQHLYLSGSYGSEQITPHLAADQKKLDKKSIHLVPIFLLPELTIDADVFISTFALSETTTSLQKEIVDRHFFHADTNYIVGQFAQNNWVIVDDEKTILKGVRTLYRLTNCIVHHTPWNTHSTYQIIGYNNNKN